MLINYKGISVNLNNVSFLSKTEHGSKSYEIYFKTNESSISFDFDNYEERDECFDFIHSQYPSLKFKSDAKQIQ